MSLKKQYSACSKMIIHAYLQTVGTQTYYIMLCITLPYCHIAWLAHITHISIYIYIYIDIIINFNLHIYIYISLCMIYFPAWLCVAFWVQEGHNRVRPPLVVGRHCSTVPFHCGMGGGKHFVTWAEPVESQWYWDCNGGIVVWDGRSITV